MSPLWGYLDCFLCLTWLFHSVVIRCVFDAGWGWNPDENQWGVPRLLFIGSEMRTDGVSSPRVPSIRTGLGSNGEPFFPSLFLWDWIGDRWGLPSLHDARIQERRGIPGLPLLCSSPWGQRWGSMRIPSHRSLHGAKRIRCFHHRWTNGSGNHNTVDRV